MSCFWSSAIWSFVHVVQSSCFQCGMTSSLFPSSSHVHMVKSTGRRVEETASIQQWYNNRIQNTCQYWCRASVSPVYSVYWWVLPLLNYFLVITDSVYSMQVISLLAQGTALNVSRLSWWKLSLFNVTPIVKLINKRKNIFMLHFPPRHSQKSSHLFMNDCSHMKSTSRWMHFCVHLDLGIGVDWALRSI